MVAFAGDIYRGVVRVNRAIVAVFASAVASMAVVLAAPATTLDDVSPVPPTAVIDVRSGTFPLSLYSTCWRGACADGAPVPGARPRPRIAIVRGERVRLRLGYDPTRLTFSLVYSVNGRSRTILRELDPSASTRFVVPYPGRILVHTFTADGDAHFSAELFVRQRHEKTASDTSGR